MSDGGTVDWVGQFLANAKERTLISGASDGDKVDQLNQILDTAIDDLATADREMKDLVAPPVFSIFGVQWGTTSPHPKVLSSTSGS